MKPDMPARLVFPSLGPDPRPYAMLGIRRAGLGEYIWNSRTNEAELISSTVIERVGTILIPVTKNFADRSAIPAWIKTKDPLSVFLRRDGRGVLKLINADGKYIGEMLLSSALGRACMATILLGLKEQGYAIIREGEREPLDTTEIRELTRQ